MDPGIAGKRPWCGGPSKGLGFGCARALAVNMPAPIGLSESVSTPMARRFGGQVMQRWRGGILTGRFGTPQELGA
jgi:hypothetical protein